jgi:hypothetical protein
VGGWHQQPAGFEDSSESWVLRWEKDVAGGPVCSGEYAGPFGVTTDALVLAVQVHFTNGEEIHIPAMSFGAE